MAAAVPGDGELTPDEDTTDSELRPPLYLPESVENERGVDPPADDRPLELHMSAFTLGTVPIRRVAWVRARTRTTWWIKDGFAKNAGETEDEETTSACCRSLTSHANGSCDHWPLEEERYLAHAVREITRAGRTWFTHHDNW